MLKALMMSVEAGGGVNSSIEYSKLRRAGLESSTSAGTLLFIPVRFRPLDGGDGGRLPFFF